MVGDWERAMFQMEDALSLAQELEELIYYL